MLFVYVANGKIYTREYNRNVFVKDGGIYVSDYEPDPDPANWRTINSSPVHLDENGEIDGGAGGKFKGNYFDGNKGGTHVIGPHTMMRKNISSGATGVMVGSMRGGTNIPQGTQTSQTAQPKEATQSVSFNANSLPKEYNTPKEAKNTKVAVQYTNELTDADPKAKELYAMSGAMAGQDGTYIDVVHRGRGYIKASGDSRGETRIEINTPVLHNKKGADLDDAMGVYYHENAHAMDYMLRDDKMKRGFFSQQSPEGTRLTETLKTYGAAPGKKSSDMGESAKAAINDYGKSILNGLDQKVDAATNKYKETLREIRERHANGQTSFDDARKAAKKAERIYKEEIKASIAPDKRHRGMGNFMDLYDALQSGTLYGRTLYKDEKGRQVRGSGHGVMYYMRTGSKNKEMVANWATLKMVNPKLAETFRKDKPEIAKNLDDILDAMHRKARSMKK